MKRTWSLFGLISLVALLATGRVAAQDTFSIVAVDPVTQEVGSAGASCIAGSIIISDVHPGVGAVHTQSYYNSQNQNLARMLMDQGASPEEIIDALVTGDAQGNPTIRQYGVVDLVDGGRSAAYTGVNCFDYKGHNLGPTYAIAGNILLGQQVLDAMETAFNSTPGMLSDKLMAALQGANIPGADTRCLDDGKPAISAFIRVARPNDPSNDFYLDLNVNNTSSNQNPIDLLQDLYDDWRATTGIVAAEAPGQSFHLIGAAPNPFNPSTMISYELGSAARVRLTVYNALGQLVAELVDAPQPAGLHRVPWSPRQTLPGGVYLARLSAGTLVETRSMLLVK